MHKIEETLASILGVVYKNEEHFGIKKTIGDRTVEWAGCFRYNDEHSDSINFVMTVGSRKVDIKTSVTVGGSVTVTFESTASMVLEYTSGLSKLRINEHGFDTVFLYDREICYHVNSELPPFKPNAGIPYISMPDAFSKLTLYYDILPEEKVLNSLIHVEKGFNITFVKER